MSAESVILEGRRFNEALMTSACTVTRQGDKILNETTGEYEYEYITVYAGPCKIKFGATEPTEIDAQGQLLVEQGAILSLPVETSGAVTTDDLAAITACTLDPSLIGKLFRVTGLHTQTAATARRFPVEVVS